MNKKILAALMCLAILCSLCVPAMAAEGTVETSGGSSTIPVNISAEATVFDVDVPTAFPITVDKTTGETQEGDNATITNNSYGSIIVSGIVAKDNADANSGTATWHLAAFTTDMSKEEVDSNKVGISVQPKRGDQTAAGTALTTDDSNAAEQTLLDSDTASAGEWIINGKDATDGSNALTIVYDTVATAVSKSITNETVAYLVVTVKWNTTD